MASDLDILRTAHGLIRLHGPDAELIAAAKIATLQKGANQHASIEAPSQSNAATLLNVSRSGVELRRSAPDPGETTH